MKKAGFSRKQLGIPYLIFLLAFVVAPLVVIVYYAFTNGSGQFTLQNLIDFFTNRNTIGTLVYSAIISVLTTLVCLLIAYPTAYILARGKWKSSTSLIMIFVMPMWINFTLRITAMKEVLTAIEGNMAFFPMLNTIIGMTYDFLPFMILPIYNQLARLDDGVMEAAADLGATPRQCFFKVALPLSVPGIISGVMMVFLPAMTNYVVLDMLYNSTYIMGSLIGSYFNVENWNNGSMISLILLAIIFIVSGCLNKYGDEEAAERGGAIF
ncbi:MAG: ABC transporter permease [Clostridiales bacterium]|nr:ABC transporter permease [Clostridiales bacterium]